MTRTRNQTADDLIPMTGVSPRQALAAAHALLATRPGPREASIAHQAAAIVLRDFGDVGAAIREFRRPGSDRGRLVLHRPGRVICPGDVGTLVLRITCITRYLRRSPWC